MALFHWYLTWLFHGRSTIGSSEDNLCDTQLLYSCLMPWVASTCGPTFPVLTGNRSSLVASTVTSFLDDFLVSVFLPQLEDTISDAFSRITDEDMFQTTSRAV